MTYMGLLKEPRPLSGVDSSQGHIRVKSHTTLKDSQNLLLWIGYLLFAISGEKCKLGPFLRNVCNEGQNNTKKKNILQKMKTGYHCYKKTGQCVSSPWTLYQTTDLLAHFTLITKLSK